MQGLGCEGKLDGIDEEEGSRQGGAGGFIQQANSLGFLYFGTEPTPLPKV